MPYRDPSNPNIIYAHSYYEGVYKTTDGGKYWRWMNNGLKTEEIKSYLSFAIDPSHPNVLYLSINDDTVFPDEHVGLYRSEDGGENWTKIWVPVDSMDVPDELVVSYAHPEILLGQIRKDGYYHLARSENSGVDWSLVDVAISGQIVSIEFHPSDPNRVIMAMSWKIGYSQDLGLTWTLQPVQIPDLTRIDSCVSDPEDSGHLFITVLSWSNDDACGIYESYDSGMSWMQLEKSSSGLLGVNFNCNPIRLYGPVSRSLDGGQTWERYERQINNMYSKVIFHPTDPDWVWRASENYGIFKALPGGLKWYKTAFSEGASTISVNPEDSDEIIIQDSQGISKSIDGGATWYASSAGIDQDIYHGFIRDPVEPDTMYCFGAKIYKSTDKGETWNIILPMICHVLDVDPLNNSKLFASVEYSTGEHETAYRVIRSIDGGLNWLPTSLERGVLDIECSPVIPGLVYASGYDDSYNRTLYVSGDGGDTWTGFQPCIENVEYYNAINNIECDYSDQNVVYCSLDDGFRISEDYGLNWYDPSPHYPFYESYRFRFELDPYHKDNIYLQNRNFCRSLERGRDWSVIANSSGAFTVSPGSSSIVYATIGRTDLGGTDRAAVFRRVFIDHPARILMAGYGRSHLSASQNGKLQILCDTDIPPETPQPVEVELLYDSIPTGLFLNDDGMEGDEVAGDGTFSIEIDIPPGASAGQFRFELIVRDVTGVVSDRWPKIHTK